MKEEKTEKNTNNTLMVPGSVIAPPKPASALYKYRNFKNKNDNDNLKKTQEYVDH